MRWKKLIAPVVITVILVGLFVAQLLGMPVHSHTPVANLIVALILLGFIGVSVFVLWERIKEIRSGEQDDLGKY